MPGFSVASGSPVFCDTGQGASDRLASWMAWSADPCPMVEGGSSVILRQDNNGGSAPVGQGGVGSWAPVLDGSSTGSTSGGDNCFYVNV